MQFNYSGATGHTLAIQDPKFDGFLLTTDAGGPKTGKVELAAGQVHPLLHGSRPRGPGHEGDAHRRHEDLAHQAVDTRRVGAVMAAVVMTVAFTACGGGGDDGGGGKAYVEPKGPSTETIVIRGQELLVHAEEAHRRAGITEMNLTAENGIHDFVFDGAYDGFQLEADGGGGRSREDRPEAGEVHLLLHDHRAPRPGHGRHAHRQVAGGGVLGTTTASAPAPVREARAAGRRARRSPTARPRPRRERFDDHVDAARRPHLRVVDVRAANTDGNVRRNSTRETGPTTHTSSRPSCTLAAGVIIIPLA